jgi:hypothetical protein
VISRFNIGLIAFLFIMLITINCMPDFQMLSPYNPNWDGISLLYKNSSGLITSSSSLNFNGVLLIINPEKMPSNTDIKNLKVFLNNGNEIIISGYGNYVNYLIRSLGGNITTYNSTVYDDVISYKSNVLPIALLNGSKLIFFYTSYLKNGYPLANTSFFSYIKNGSHDIYGPFVAVSKEKINKGELIVIADPYFFTNYVITLGDNYNFFLNLTNGKKYYIGTFLQKMTPYQYFKEKLVLISNFISQTYMQLILIPSLFILSFIFYNMKREEKVNKLVDLNKIMKEHPDWDIEIVKKILEEKNNEAR